MKQGRVAAPLPRFFSSPPDSLDPLGKRGNFPRKMQNLKKNNSRGPFHYSLKLWKSLASK